MLQARKKTLNPDILSKTKLRYMGSCDPFTVELSITLHFKRFLFRIYSPA